MASKIIHKYHQRIKKTNSLLCVGLDSNYQLIPDKFKKDQHPQFAFNREIIDQTHQAVVAYKLNFAFYEARGLAGLEDLISTSRYIRDNYPDIVLIADAKRGDIGSTNLAYAQAIFDKMAFDAVTLNPFVGQEALRVFLDRTDKACIFLCKTSNPGAGEFQDLLVNKQTLWLTIAKQISQKWNQNQNCMLAVGATYPQELAQVRKMVGEMPLLVPGIGTQGGDLAAIMQYGLNRQKAGLIINSSRGIIFNQNPQQVALKLQTAINQYR